MDSEIKLGTKYGVCCRCGDVVNTMNTVFKLSHQVCEDCAAVVDGLRNKYDKSLLSDFKHKTESE